MNQLFYGDNLEVLRRDIADQSVDLCYIDPPFNSKRNYNQIYNNIGREDYAQAQAFSDTWTWNELAQKGLDEILTNATGHYTAKIAALTQGLKEILGRGSFLSYLVQMTQRVVEIHRVLKPTGSFYLHCDPTASHYLKIICDAVFVENGGDFLNEITWKRTTAHSDAKRFGATSDIILFYVKSNEYTWNRLSLDHSDEYLSRFKRSDPDGRRWQDDNLSAKGLTGGGYDYTYKGATSLWRVPLATMERLDAEGRLYFTSKGGIRIKRYLDELDGVAIQNVWTDIPPINSQSKERLGYPTQKPLALMRRIIGASSQPGDTILDCFCGCGTTIVAAEEMGRNWIGIDITYQSIGLVLQRLEDSFGKQALSTIKIAGIPRDIDSARALATRADDRTRKEFEKWAVMSYANNRAIINEKKGADKGIDGMSYVVSGKETYDKIVYSVKSGGVGVKDLRDFNTAIDEAAAVMGVFITLDEPTKPMRDLAVSLPAYTAVNGQKYPKIRLVTIAELIDGESLQLPAYTVDTTKRAIRSENKRSQGKLDL